MADQLDDVLTKLPTVSGPIRLIAAIFGCGLVLAGAVAVFATANSAGAASLVVAGSALGALAMFANSIQSVKAGSFEMVLRARVARLQADAQDAERKGEFDEAAALRGEADLLLLAAQPVASEFERVRREMAKGPQRTYRQEGILRQARQAAEGVSDDAGPTVEKLFNTGGDGQRIFAIGIMQGKPALATTQVIEAGLRHSRSAFEQFQTLVLALEMVNHNPGSGDTAQIRKAIEQMLAEQEFDDDSDRAGMARLILDSLPPPT